MIIGFKYSNIFHQDERTFSEEEEEKLQGSLELAGPDLELVLQSLEFFLQQVTAMNPSRNFFSRFLIWFKWRKMNYNFFQM